MKHSILFSIVIGFASIILFSSCDDDDPTPENPEELITYVSLSFSPTSGGSMKVLEFNDADGEGGNAPVITVDTLEAGTEYTLSLQLLNEAASPAIDVADEVRDEAEEHQLFFLLDGVNVEIEYDDQDADGNPIGLENICTTTESGSGTLTVVLRHEPDKFASGVSNGDITLAGGSTDLEITFPLHVK